MPQIQIVTGSQRIDPSSPVAITGTADSRMQGEASEAFGKALFDAGNLLDTVAKKAKDNEDKLSVTRAVNQARLEMLKIKAAQDAEGIRPDDSADGVSGIERYNQKLNPVLDTIAAQLPSDKLRSMFAAGISDDVVTYSTQVLAGEVGKRERNVPVMMQETINQRATLSRQDYSQLPMMMAEAELDVGNNSMIAEANKPAQLLAYQKQIGKEALSGFIDRGNAGDPRAWQQAREQLTKNPLYNIFTSEEKDKILGNIDQADFGFSNRAWNNIQRTNAVDDREAKERVMKASTTDMQALATAGNSDIRRAPILRKIELDPTYDRFPEIRKRMIENRTFMETADDTYQVAIMDKALRTKNFTKVLDQLQAEQGDKVSMDRASKLQTAIRGMQDFNQKNPYVMKALDQARDELNAYKKPPTFDVVSGMMKQENDTYNEKAQTELMAWAARTSSSGTISAGAIESKLKSILGTYYGGRSVVKPVQGVSPDKLTTVKGTNETAAQLTRDRLKGLYNTPEKMREYNQKMRDLKENQGALKAKEDATVRVNSGGTSKIFDEE